MLNKTQMHEQIERYRKQMEDAAAALDMLREQDVQLEAKIDANIQRIQTLRRDVDAIQKELRDFIVDQTHDTGSVEMDLAALDERVTFLNAPWDRLADGTFGDRLAFLFSGTLPKRKR